MPDVPGIRATERIPVRFAGDGAGLEPLSWGQLEIWQTMLRQRSWLPLGEWTALPEGTTVDDVADDLRWAMQRYPTYRTRLILCADGNPLQLVAADGTIHLDVFDVPPGTDPVSYVESVDARYRATPMDHTADWPVRMGVVRVEGQVRYLVPVVCHLVMDGVGARIMLREVADRSAAVAPQGMQPLEQARWQASPAGAQLAAKAAKHWDKALRQLPPVAAPVSFEVPRFHRGEFASAALYTATHAVSNIADIDTSQILMTYLAVCLTELHGDGRPAVVRPMVDNRFRRGLGDVVAMVAQRGIFAVDVAGVPWAEALRRTGLQAMLAYKFAYHDPAGVGAGLDVDLDGGIWFNDRRTVSRQMFPGTTPTAEEVGAAAPGSFRWTVAQDDPFDPLSVDVDEEPGVFRLTWFTDAWRLPPARIEALALAVEALAVQQALEALEKS